MGLFKKILPVFGTGAGAVVPSVLTLRLATSSKDEFAAPSFSLELPDKPLVTAPIISPSVKNSSTTIERKFLGSGSFSSVSVPPVASKPGVVVPQVSEETRIDSVNVLKKPDEKILVQEEDHSTQNLDTLESPLPFQIPSPTFQGESVESRGKRRVLMNRKLNPILESSIVGIKNIFLKLRNLADDI